MNFDETNVNTWLPHDETKSRNDHCRRDNERFRLAHNMLSIGRIIERLKNKDQIFLGWQDTDADLADLALEIIASFNNYINEHLMTFGTFIYFDDYVAMKVKEKYGKENTSWDNTSGRTIRIEF